MKTDPKKWLIRVGYVAVGVMATVTVFTTMPFLFTVLALGIMLTAVYFDDDLDSDYDYRDDE